MLLNAVCREIKAFTTSMRSVVMTIRNDSQVVEEDAEDIDLP